MPRPTPSSSNICIFCSLKPQIRSSTQRRPLSIRFTGNREDRREGARHGAKRTPRQERRHEREVDNKLRAKRTAGQHVPLEDRWDYPRKVKNAFEAMYEELEAMPMMKTFKVTEKEFQGTFKSFASHVKEILEANKVSLPRADELLVEQLRSVGNLHSDLGSMKMHRILRHAFVRHILALRFSQSETSTQKSLADLRYPLEWFPGARQLNRKIIMHVGPTNSGKTYQALKRLEEAESGAYAGPLRLLAHEVYNRLNSKGIPCALVTGEERRIPEEQREKVNKRACTVEMLTGDPMDVCVIDEIQMIGDASRGWAWTEALCGVKAKEIHLCGEERTVPIIRELATMMGDSLEIRNYTRLSPLAVAPHSLNGDLSQLQKGDCLVSFSVVAIHALRKQIEEKTGRSVAIIYGSLPPEVRAQQARLFNDPDNDYDFLVASDAVGMGLNLSIKRVIFESVRKNDGVSYRTLAISDIKQIGGRAGRYKVAPSTTQKVIAQAETTAQIPDVNEPVELPADETVTTKQLNRSSYMDVKDGDQTQGWVTTLEEEDLPIVKEGMAASPEAITSAGIHPPAEVVKRFSNYFPPGTPFSFIIQRLHEFAQMQSRFHLCNTRDHVIIADTIQNVEGLAIEDRLIFCQAPVATSDAALLRFTTELATCAATQSGGSILELTELDLELLDDANIDASTSSASYLKKLETLHKQIILYLWLSFRFAGIFHTRALANHVKALVEAKIEQALSRVQISEKARRARRRMERENALLEALRKQNLLASDGEGKRLNQESNVEDALDVAESDMSEGEIASSADEGERYPVDVDGQVAESEQLGQPHWESPVVKTSHAMDPPADDGISQGFRESAAGAA